MPVGGDKLYAYQVHSAAGLPVLLLAIGRVAWRLIIPGPVSDADRQGLQTNAAYAIHYLFYACFFGLPISGWGMWFSIAAPDRKSVGEGKRVSGRVDLGGRREIKKK